MDWAQIALMETGVAYLALAGADNPGPAWAVACLNLFVAVTLVSVSLLLGLAVSILLLLCDRAREAQLIRLTPERWAVRRSRHCCSPGA